MSNISQNIPVIVPCGYEVQDGIRIDLRQGGHLTRKDADRLCNKAKSSPGIRGIELLILPDGYSVMHVSFDYKPRHTYIMPFRNLEADFATLVC